MKTRVQLENFSVVQLRGGSLRIEGTSWALQQIALTLADARANGAAVLPMAKNAELVVRCTEESDADA